MNNRFNWERSNRREAFRRSEIEINDVINKVRRIGHRDRIARAKARRDAKEAKRLAEVAARIRQLMYREK